MSDALAAWIRTTTPVLIGMGLTWLATKAGFVLDENTSTAVTTGVTGVAIAVYYTAVKWLESKVPAFGWLLGLAKKPVYAAPGDTVRVNGVTRQGGEV